MALLGCSEAMDVDGASKLLANGETQAAYRAYRDLADQGNARAEFGLALFYHNGWGRPTDPVEACRLYERAAAGDIPVAHHRLAECLTDAVHRKAEEGEVLHHYRAAAEIGHAISWCDLARLDPQQSLEPCRELTLYGSAPAMEAMAELLSGGRPEARDLNEARRLLKQAAGRDSPTAALRLGRMLRDGAFGVPDPAGAARWLEHAASLRHREAYLEAGAHYLGDPAELAHSKPSEEQLARAYLWLRVAERAAASDEQRTEARALLEWVYEIMPPSWKPDLDRELERFFAAES